MSFYRIVVVTPYGEVHPSHYEPQYKAWWWSKWQPIYEWYQPEIMDMPGWYSCTAVDEAHAIRMIQKFKSTGDPRNYRKTDYIPG